ncbi:MAG: hypothetical protein IIB62_12780, partial [Proteobacteria bacterium]|nr:hypothetical protein [Pseudomonadota bacterium]
MPRSAYLFWHQPFSDISHVAYEDALVAFHRELAKRTCDGFQGSATYRISETPWLDGIPAYEDWNFVESSASLDPLNKMAVAPDMWDIHAGISSKTDIGHGGIYYHVLGVADPKALTRTAWLKRPRGIRYEGPLKEITDQVTGPVSVWRKQMVLGPGFEFAVLDGAGLQSHAKLHKKVAVRSEFLDPHGGKSAVRY